MFKEVIDAIKKKDYISAQQTLASLLEIQDVQVQARANYLLGYINSQWDNENKNYTAAKRYLHNNLSSPEPYPYAYVLYSEVEEDKNVSINYLEIGSKKFPKDPQILQRLLLLSPDKDSILVRIKASGLTDNQLLGSAIHYLISLGRWDEIRHYISLIQQDEDLTSNYLNYLNLLLAYSFLLDDCPNYAEAQKILTNLIREDTDNELAYAPYLGLVYSLLIQNDLETATNYFDRIPLTNVLHDFNDGPWYYDIDVDFSEVYKIIFQAVINAFSKDDKRKLKAKALYSLYLYYPADIFGLYRYKKADANVLARCLKIEFNPHVAAALYHMYCHYEQYQNAYSVLMSFFKNYKNPEDYDVYSYEFLNNTSPQDNLYIAQYVSKCLQEDDFDLKCFTRCMLKDLIATLQEAKAYPQIVEIAEQLSDAQIINAEIGFQCAYAYGESHHERAAKLYEAIIKVDSQNDAAINNLGVIYEHCGKLQDAIQCYEKAVELDPEDRIHQNNLKRVRESLRIQRKKEIESISKKITYNALENIGYSEGFLKKIASISDHDMGKLLSRDIKECAIAIVSHQDKTATVMCGSIMETILLSSIQERGISTYLIGETSKRVVDMALHDLLTVAENENIINKNSYHLAHYIRDYRNVIHPAKEIRMGESITHENVMTMWAIIKRLIWELY